MAIINFKNILTVDFDDDALKTATVGEHVLNFAVLTTTGDLANGIFAGANDVTVRNFGDIETAGLGAAGIFVQGDNARIENYGSVHTTGDFTEDELYFSEGLFAEGNAFYVANFGTILVEGGSASALVGVGADGVVVNYGHVDSDSIDSSAIAVFADRSQAINAGLMTIRGDATAGIFALGEDSSALNRGEIVVTGSLNTAVEGVLANTRVTNHGIIRIEADASTGIAGIGDGHQVGNFGLIETHGTFTIGASARGGGPLALPGLDLEIINGGRITTEGDLAIGAALGVSPLGFRPAEDGQIDNRGIIETQGDGSAGVIMAGDGHHLINSGRITADGGAFADEAVGELRAAGVLVSGDGAVIENTRTGVIESKNADSAAVELNMVEREGLSAADTSSHLENFGLIKGAAIAVLGGDGQETVVNHGRIVGGVVLGDGADTFVFGKGGTLSGNLFLGGGDDLVVVEDGSGKSRIADFVAGAASDDQIDVSVFFANFDDLIAHSSQRGDDVFIALDHNDQLVLSHVQRSGLTFDDFLFA